MDDTRPRPQRTRPKDDRVAASAAPKKPLLRVEVDRDALAAIDKRTVAAQVGIGLAAGWLASWVVGGNGLIRYAVTGLIGAFVGGYLLERLGVELGVKDSVFSRIATATLGASLVVLLARILA